MKKYLRTITDLFPKKYGKFLRNKQLAIQLRRFLFLFFAIMIGVLLQILVVLNAKYIDAKDRHTLKVGEYEYWSNVALQFPQIPDILYNAAASSYMTGRIEESIQLLDRALAIDPLFEKARILRSKVVGER